MCLLATAAVLAALVPASSAFASFPGGNGKIAFVRSADIWVMNRDGSDEKQLTSGPAGDYVPAWSPDGDRISFSSNRDGDFEIYVMDADGGGVEQLTNNSTGDYVPAWSPSGRKLVFVSDRDGDKEIFVMKADGSGQTQLTENTTVADVDPSWSPDGGKIVFVHEESESCGPGLTGDGFLGVMNPDGSGLTLFDDTPFTECNDTVADPNWSPDGERIAYTGHYFDAGPEIWATRPGEAPPGGLLFPAAAERCSPFHYPCPQGAHPAWSPNGRRIAFAGNTDPLLPTGEILVMDADGGEERARTSTPDVAEETPDWQPIVAQRLQVTGALRRTLRAVFLEAHSLGSGEVVGPLRQSVYYARFREREWALGTFSVPELGTQDQPELFRRRLGAPWVDLGDTGGSLCRVPLPVVTAWRLLDLRGGC